MMFFINILLHRWLSKLITYSTNCLKCNVRLNCFGISCSNVSKLAILENDSLRMKQILNIHFPSLLSCYSVKYCQILYTTKCAEFLLYMITIVNLHFSLEIAFHLYMTDVLILMMSTSIKITSHLKSDSDTNYILIWKVFMVYNSAQSFYHI